MRAALFGLFALITSTAQAQSLRIELNAQTPVEGACQISFVAQNTRDAAVEAAIFETVLFDTDGKVALLTLFDFGKLPAKRTRVRQFAVPGLRCDALGQMLINGAQTCKVAGADSDVCADLELSSRTDLKVLQ